MIKHRRRAMMAPVILSFTLISGLAFAQPVTAVLRLKEKVALETLAADVKSPFSSRFGRYYAPEEIRAVAGPEDADYDALIAQLKSEGFEVSNESPTHLWLTVKADSKVFDQVFGSQLKTSATGLRHNMVEAQVPPRMSIVDAVVGLDNTRRSHPLFVKDGLALTSSPGGVSQSTIKKAYGFDAIYQAGITGKGQDIAVATYDGFNIDDVNYFYKASGLSVGTSGPNVDLVNFNGIAPYNEDSATETELDAEFTGMMAPGANVHVFASAANNDAGELQMFTAILDDNRSKVVNYSWGDCEANLSPAHQAEMVKVFARALVQGVNIMVASGDSGSDGCRNKTLSAGWPAAAPYVVGVGGTTFSQGSNGLAKEKAWSGSGGGISVLFDLPAWQSSLPAPYVKRSFPDVAFNADPQTGQALYTHAKGQAGWMVIGGTSMAAPQWSGFMALVGEARQTANKPALGYLNPLIYGLSATDRAATFNDVTSGANGAYKAGKGWDAVTGLGSLHADVLFKYLSGI